MRNRMQLAAYLCRVVTSIAALLYNSQMDFVMLTLQRSLLQRIVAC